MMQLNWVCVTCIIIIHGWRGCEFTTDAPFNYQFNHSLYITSFLPQSTICPHVVIILTNDAPRVHMHVHVTIRLCMFLSCCLGDWHIAYLLLYSPLRLEKLKDEGEGQGTAEAVEPMDTTQTSAGDDKPASS